MKVTSEIPIFIWITLGTYNWETEREKRARDENDEWDTREVSERARHKQIQ